MSSIFEEYLDEIADNIYPDGDHNGFYRVLDLVKDTVNSNRLLNSICFPRFISFGSTAHGIRMYDMDEYDVMIELEFPNYDQILVRPDQHRPGIVQLCFNQMDSHEFVEDTLLDYRWYLQREEIRNLMDNILNVIDGRQVYSPTESCSYTLNYEYRRNCHTIIATSRTRQFSIDFVPAIKVEFEGEDIQVVPKFVPGPKRSSGCTFMVSNITMEVSMFEEGGRMMQKAVMLLKLLCESKGLPKIRFYHLVSLALWLMDGEDIDQYSLEDAFLDLLNDLCQAFEDNDLTYYPYEELDLLSNFRPNQLARYKQVLNEAYMTLKTYPHQELLSYERCSWHFFGDD